MVTGHTWEKIMMSAAIEQTVEMNPRISAHKRKSPKSTAAILLFNFSQMECLCCPGAVSFINSAISRPICAFSSSDIGSEAISSISSSQSLAISSSC